MDDYLGLFDNLLEIFDIKMKRSVTLNKDSSKTKEVVIVLNDFDMLFAGKTVQEAISKVGKFISKDLLKLTELLKDKELRIAAKKTANGRRGKPESTIIDDEGIEI